MFEPTSPFLIYDCFFVMNQRVFVNMGAVATHSCFKGTGLLGKFIHLNGFLIPCSPLLVRGILAVVKIRTKNTYEHQCSFHRQ